MTLPEIAVKRPIGTLMVLISILVLGLIALDRLELAFMPESERKTLFVVSEYPNASPKVLERVIVKPIEEALASMNGVEHMWSNADSRGARVNLSFALEVDMDLARAEIHERIDRIKDELPEDLERVIVSANWNPRESGETIIEARLSSGRDLSKNYDLLDRKIVKPLERIPGVAVVSLDGVNPREVLINLDLKKLRQHKIDARGVWLALLRNNQNRTAGILRNSQQKLIVRAVGELKTIEQIAALPLAGYPIKLGDVATITYTEPPLEYGRHIDGDFAIGLSIAKESSANTIVIADAVHQAIAKMESDPELDGINFLVWQDQGKEIRNTLNDLKQTGLVGAILASLVLFLFLRKFTTTIVAVFCIPFSLVVACGVIWLQGKTLNTISLLGLIVGIGMLVDNAVVIMENIDRYQQKGYTGRVAAILGAKEVSVAVVTATLTSVIVFLPMIYTKSNSMNVILQELGITICITLIASLFISQTLIPLAATKLLRSQSKPKASPIISWLQNQYEVILVYTLKYFWIALVALAAGLFSIYYSSKNVNLNLTPSPAATFVSIGIDIGGARSLEVTEEIIEQVEQSLLPHKDDLNIDSVYSFWSESVALTRLYMKTGHQNESDMNVVRKRLPSLLPEIPGVKLQVQDNTPFWQRNSGKRVAVSLSGPDSELLGEIAEQALAKIEPIDGLFDFYTTAEGGRLELHSELDRDKMHQYGIAPNQPASSVELTFRGRRLASFKGEDGEVEMRLVLDEAQSTSISDLKNVTLNQANESQVTLDSIAEFSTQKGPNRIRRQNKVSSVWVGARFESGKQNEYRNQIVEILSEMSLPPGYEWEFNSRWRGQQESQVEFLINLGLAILLIVIVMAGLFESISQSFSLVFSLPFAIVGALWTLLIAGVDFDQPASVAFLLLLGVVVNNGIVMTEHINLYRREGWPRDQAMIRGGKERLRPIIMTAVTTLVGLIPIIVQKPSLGGVYYYSMAYVIIGGLFVSTIATGLLLPAMIKCIEFAVGFIIGVFKLILGRATTIDWDELKHPTPKKSVEV